MKVDKTEVSWFYQLFNLKKYPLKADLDLDDIIEIIEDLENKGETKWIKLKFRKTLEVR